MTESRFYNRVKKLLEEGRIFAIAYLVEARGSAPQRPRAKLIVHPDGKTEFTIGGGTLEARAIKEARLLLDLEHERTMLKEYFLGDLGMYCGGAVKVFYETVKEKWQQFYSRVEELLQLQRQAPFIVAHLVNAPDSFPWQRGAKIILHPDGGIEFWGSNFEGLQNLILREAKMLFSGSLLHSTMLKKYEFEDLGLPHEGSLEIFFEVVNKPLRLLIFGAGHVGAKLAELAKITELFQIEVADDRAEYANFSRLPFADRIYLMEENFSGELPQVDERTFVTIMTRCHETDRIVLKRVLAERGRAAYIGMIGSKAKRAQLFKMLEGQGISEECISLVHTPIGLPIGGKDPGEIAVSVLAEIIKVKNELELE